MAGAPSPWHTDTLMLTWPIVFTCVCPALHLNCTLLRQKLYIFIQFYVIHVLRMLCAGHYGVFFFPKESQGVGQE